MFYSSGGKLQNSTRDYFIKNFFWKPLCTLPPNAVPPDWTKVHNKYHADIACGKSTREFSLELQQVVKKAPNLFKLCFTRTMFKLNEIYPSHHYIASCVQVSFRLQVILNLLCHFWMFNCSCLAHSQPNWLFSYMYKGVNFGYAWRQAKKGEFLVLLKLIFIGWADDSPAESRR